MEKEVSKPEELGELFNALDIKGNKELDSEKNKEEKEIKQIKDAIISRKTIDEIDSADEQENLKRIEAALFISGKFLSMHELVALTDINPILLRELLEKIIEKYSSENSAIEIIKKENLWKMDVRPNYTYMVNKLATGKSEFSKAEQETLAIIAYKQPIKQSVIVKIRGNKAYEHIKKFIELGLIKAKKTSHTLELNLSEEFYDYFHVNSSQED